MVEPAGRSIKGISKRQPTVQRSFVYKGFLQELGSRNWTEAGFRIVFARSETINSFWLKRAVQGRFCPSSHRPVLLLRSAALVWPAQMFCFPLNEEPRLGLKSDLKTGEWGWRSVKGCRWTTVTNEINVHSICQHRLVHAGTWSRRCCNL